MISARPLPYQNQGRTAERRSRLELRQRWAEAQAERSEPETRKARREEKLEEQDGKAKGKEKVQARNPILLDGRSSYERAVATHVGVVFLTGSDGELADIRTVRNLYFPPWVR